MKAWSSLPNAKHIDRVIDSFTANPLGWYSAETVEIEDAWNKTRIIGEKQAIYDSATDAIYYPMGREGIEYHNRCAAYNAISALIVYEDCAYMLDSDPGELAILAKFGDKRAILLLDACKALAMEKSVA